LRKKQKIAERTKQLRTLITRAKEDAERWGTDQPSLLLSGIEEKSADDFSIYDEAYTKFLMKRKKTMSTVFRNEGEAEELHKKAQVFPFTESGRSRTETELKRIADALERIADILENEIDKDC
jgi:hypothetical protein